MRPGLEDGQKNLAGREIGFDVLRSIPKAKTSGQLPRR